MARTKIKKKTLFSVHSTRDGERVCGPFPKDVAERERARLDEEAAGYREETPVHSMVPAAGAGVAEPVERALLREIAEELRRPDLAERIPDVDPSAALVPSDPRAPTVYELRPVELPADVDPFDEDESAFEQASRILNAAEEG